MGDMGSLAWSGLWPQACSRGTFLRWDIYITGKITSLLHSFTSSLDHGPRHCLRDAWSESRAGPRLRAVQPRGTRSAPDDTAGVYLRLFFKSIPSHETHWVAINVFQISDIK